MKLFRYSKPVFLQTAPQWRAAACNFIVVAGLSLCGTTGTAQPAPAQATSAAKFTSTPASATTQLVLPAGFGAPAWSELTPAQQAALRPLASSWGGLNDAHKRKWISLSANFPQLQPTEQTKMHARMVQWAALSPREREQARLNFAETKQVDPQKKNEQWQTYQALSAEEKQKLAKSAQPQPPRTALAAQPVASDKINRAPLSKKTDGTGQPGSPNTLLPRLAPPARPTPPAAPIPPASVVIIDGVSPQ